MPTRANAVRLFLLGYLTLFLELALIRYLGGTVWNLGYFPNLVLMSAFIGMGLGFVFHPRVTDGGSPRLVELAAFVLLWLVAFVSGTHPALPGFTNWLGQVGGEVFYTAAPHGTRAWSYVFIGVMFASLVLIFALISQRTAKIFRSFPPLRAYSIDIAGSCAGILSFMLVSRLGIPAFVWFLAAGAIVFAVLESSRAATAVAVLATAVIVWRADHSLSADRTYHGPYGVAWSPYQKVEWRPLDGGVMIWVNGIAHQMAQPLGPLLGSFYVEPYRFRSRENLPRPDNVLIVGAGSGNDVAAALLNGAQHVDAVEIDPVIARIGREEHPLHPYQDTRVTQIVDDARAFMTRTTRRYDVIVFALTDSLVKVSPVTQLRLENYIFTVESVRRATALLADRGSLVFYNYYRVPWVRTKIERMTFEVAGAWPVVIRQSGDFAMLTIDSEHHGEPPVDAGSRLDLPRDDWPFPYLRVRGIPPLYRNALVGMSAFVGVLALALHRERRATPASPGTGLIPYAFLLMGTAFLLLETKSVIQFSLLFGTTWLNNSLVFLAILVSVLAANWAATVVRGRHILPIAYGLLMAACVGAVFYPMTNLLSIHGGVARFAAASLLTFSPIFIANVIFSLTLARHPSAERLFGWNLLGGAVGGLLEYSSMALGYAALGLVVAGCYTVVFVLLMLERRGASFAAGEPATGSNRARPWP